VKKKITDLLDTLPIEILDEIESYHIPKRMKRKSKILIAVAIVVVLLAGCSAYVISEMPYRFQKYFQNSSNELVNKLYIDTTEYVEYENYRLAVEGIISDKNSKKLVLTVTATSESAKENFTDTCPSPIIITGGSNSSVESSMSTDNKYKKEFYYDIKTTNTECSAILYEGYNNIFDLYTQDFTDEINVIMEELEKKEKYSYSEIFEMATKQAIEEKVGKILSFSIASKDDDEISLELSDHNTADSLVISKIIFTKMGLSIYGNGLKKEEFDTGETEYGINLIDIEPSVIIILDDGSDILLLRGTMGYEAEGIPLSGTKRSVEASSAGDFNHYIHFSEPIDLEHIVKIKVNNIEYIIMK